MTLASVKLIAKCYARVLSILVKSTDQNMHKSKYRFWGNRETNLA